MMRRIFRATRLVARDGDIPGWLRGLAAVGVAPIPGPFDEAVLLVVAAILWLGYRERLRAAWRDASAAPANDRVREKRRASEKDASGERSDGER